MQGTQLFEYAVIRVVPRPEREEFLNVGVILYCKDLDYLSMLYTLNNEKLLSLCNDVCIDELKEHLAAFEHICNGNTSSLSPIAALNTASRFRWLTATRSTILQSSKVHPGLCTDPAETLQKLFAQLVL